VLSIAVRDFLVPMVFWSAVFVLVSLGIGVVTGMLCMRRLRQARAATLTRSLVWFGRLWMIVGLGLVPAIIAVVQAVPFAVERSLAHAIDRGSPVVVEWTTRVAADYAASAFDITNDQTMVDLGPFQRQLADLIADTERAPAHFSFRGIKRWAQLAFLRAMQKGLTDLGGGRDQMSWADLVTLATGQLQAGSGMLLGGLRVALHTAAWTNVYMAVLLIGLCHAVTLAVFFLAFRPTAAGPAELPTSG
jgi:hypothetical protein